ncbi:MAG: hypothetical protein H6511_01435 [Holophagales bacterium]|nr:hypothetical protein [Holophagales bacterium]
MVHEEIESSPVAARPWWSFGCAGDMTATDIRNLGRFNLWALIWALVFVVAAFALRSDWASHLPSVRLAVACAPLIAAFRALGAYRTFLRSADELLRKIHLEAIALGFAVGFVLATGWPIFERLGAPPLETALIGTAMVFGWSFGIGLGRRRYA